MKRIFLGVLIVTIVLLSLAGCGDNKEEEKPSSNEGATLSSFYGKTLDGETFTEEDLKKVDVTVINFWSTTCPKCIDEMPELSEFEKDLPDNVQLITVCLDESDKEEETRAIIDDSDFQGHAIYKISGDLSTYTQNIMYVPTTIFVDSNGNIVGEEMVGVPANLPQDYKANINKVLSELGKEEIK